MSKKRCVRTEFLPGEIVECILERLPVKSLVRFKGVSKQWESTIESPLFKENQMRHRQKSGVPDVFMLTDEGEDGLCISTLASGAISPVQIPTPWDKENTDYFNCGNSCDGLVCLYAPYKPIFVFNPTTRWYRTLPLCGLQLLRLELGKSYYKLEHRISKLAFGKDTFRGTYKAVWLYNSAEIGLPNVTTCEVFDFHSNCWSYVIPSSPYRVHNFTGPICVDGSIYWFTQCEEIKVVSFDLHTETFQVIYDAPFARESITRMVMCNLNNRLCVSVKKASNQVIWSFDSDNKTWSIMGTIHLDILPYWYDIPQKISFLVPLAISKETGFLFCDHFTRRLPDTKDFDTDVFHDIFFSECVGNPVCYFPTLISI